MGDYNPFNTLYDVFLAPVFGERENPVPVPRPFELKLEEKVKALAKKQCKCELEAFAKCAEDRTMTVVFACRPKFRELQACLGSYTNRDALNYAKLRWIEAGKPKPVDWDQLLGDVYSRLEPIPESQNQEQDQELMQQENIMR
eukprot:TRINITY_DN25204_c0_g1_i1.p3 TRINITY_DN25204_c0_g1~~TRINITY_DN25204_c0_g1_i1.p3  ORF type:complete len:143 (-),score=20.81 TRINITY_DN25204_c0_g1_i1:535-963(-)